MPSDRTDRPSRSDSEARHATRLSTWFALVAAALGVVLVIWPYLLPVGGPWVQLALGAMTLFFAFRARAIGMRGVKDYDGRLSLLAALAGFGILFFAGNAAFKVLMSLAG
ncbi:hypothetical protein FM104_10320 [Microbacterium esteraromaticum]|uniref:Uncharacterized protein n=1 Tax=Microbacterium esteraromaticum TaxID=57043 RepID=A0A1R4K4C4_9MICO|nr:hypothetical protein [Microbacterium esteraromaticum]SJN39034.1 hypothetical protein FM104_10320 [Microbacterium esteraromaticum]